MKSNSPPSLPSRPSVQKEVPGVYASLADLVALQFNARGFSFLPRQPIHSLLSGRHASRLARAARFSAAAMGGHGERGDRWQESGYWLTPALAALLLPFFRKGWMALTTAKG